MEPCEVQSAVKIVQNGVFVGRTYNRSAFSTVVQLECLAVETVCNLLVHACFPRCVMRRGVEVKSLFSAEHTTLEDNAGRDAVGLVQGVNGNNVFCDIAPHLVIVLTVVVVCYFSSEDIADIVRIPALCRHGCVVESAVVFKESVVELAAEIGSDTCSIVCRIGTDNIVALAVGAGLGVALPGFFLAANLVVGTGYKTIGADSGKIVELIAHVHERHFLELYSHEGFIFLKHTFVRMEEHIVGLVAAGTAVLEVEASHRALNTHCATVCSTVVGEIGTRGGIAFREVERQLCLVEQLPFHKSFGKSASCQLHIVHEETVCAPDAHILVGNTYIALNHRACGCNPFVCAVLGCCATEHLSEFAVGITEHEHIHFGVHIRVVHLSVKQLKVVFVNAGKRPVAFFIVGCGTGKVV